MIAFNPSSTHNSHSIQSTREFYFQQPTFTNSLPQLHNLNYQLNYTTTTTRLHYNYTTTTEQEGCHPQLLLHYPNYPTTLTLGYQLPLNYLMRHAIGHKHKAHGEFSKKTSIHTTFKHNHQRIAKTEMQA
jgi:hypothetical protein